MTTSIQRSALVPYTPAEMFALVSDIDTYADFLPWCSASRVLERPDEDQLKARVEISKGGLHKAFTTHNRHQQDKCIEMRLVEGPFKRLEGFWQFDPMGETACKVSLDLEFEFANRMLSMMVGPVFNQIANTLVDAFHERARQVYGKR
ncbi:ubiquinone-binding protein [Thiohalobacter sp. COW1]|uniref:Oligoketide cyclase/lipid transport protein n=1 Tax=Thiohalobacter thiocyanaticus TaxID=585455 RepID=A0A1Z4VRG4_9GAMM|nr:MULTISPECIES: type II toxin-antitoxin system RatA family toxin [Thiohalobacter]BAZ94073.1 oligoketide cyclase/lipid transport protein [Thiohalobacter thiocyanaticus]BCO30872.1 ubiquinone-binding protein [Thiohalobacter sp. COW1]